MEPEDDSRSGVDLFRELLRLWQGAVVEEYYNYHSGVWDRECLLIDIELIVRHRQEVGAPEPPPLEEIPEIDLTPPHRPSKSSQRSSGKSTSDPPDEEQEVREFAHGWRLDLKRTKQLLSLVRPTRRRWVMQSFTHDGFGDAMEQLELLIEVSEGQVLQPVAQTSTPASLVASNPRKRMPPMVGSVAKLAKTASHVQSEEAGACEVSPTPRMRGSVGLISTARKPLPRLNGSVGLVSSRSPPLVGTVARQPSQLRKPSEEALVRPVQNSIRDAGAGPVAARGSIAKLLPPSGASIQKKGEVKKSSGLISSLLAM